MASRIERHRRERGGAWRTVEEPRELVGALRALAGAADPVVVDCVTLWVGNRQLGGDSDELILAEADALAGLIAARSLDVTLVSNEVGEGVHPETEAGLRFRDLLGAVNQRLAAACDRVVLMVAGLPLTIKHASARGIHADTVQAP
jgi:adenosylcobinamide kinase/adenosylcobinamide-phosphate guanylyltransferase